MTTAPEDLIRQLGDALRRRSRADSARIVHAIIATRPPLGARWKSMAAIAKQNGEVDDALAAMGHYVAEAGSTASARYELAALSAQLGRLHDADAIMADLPAATPTAADYHYSCGTLATNLGDFDRARDHLRRAVAVNPGSGQAWLALAMTGPVAPVDRAALDAAAPHISRADAVEFSAYHYAVGKAQAEGGAHDAAFAAFATGAVPMRAARPYDARADRADAARAITGWAALLAEQSALANPAAAPDRPIFVTGLPRSGTTLVEQILASHSAVDGGEELGLMQLVTQDIGAAAADTRRFISAGGTAADLARLYLHLAAQRQPGAGRLIDKSLDTSRHLGLIALMFPAAPIIWMRRDPLDCAWSALRTWFLRGLDWSWSLTDIAAHFAIEDQLLIAWQHMLGDRITVVDYAALVEHPAREIDRINAACGLVTEPAQLRPHESNRAVKTASVAQVRRPINKDALAAAAPYRQHLEPFVAAYDVATAHATSF
ncbi:MAG: hypothetical protein RLZZ58_402 [Pseudomonadota bacterium]